ncbi:tagatose-6-phosphate kinase [Clostridia bacterium]|nr:tagatose-6-phosphate kinase [Clostridia bacterium]
MINTLTLNPAVDLVYFIPHWEPGITIRSSQPLETLGGKGTHVSVNLRKMGIPSRAFGIGRGSIGTRIVSELETLGVESSFLLRDAGQSRTNIILVEEETKICTMIAERGVKLSNEDTEEIVSLLSRKISSGDYLVISGDASNSPDPNIYNRILDALKEKDLKILIDASGETLKKSLAASPYLLKPNRDELEYIVGEKLNTEQEVIRGIRSLEKYQIEIIAVSLGGDGAIVKMGENYYRTTPPKVSVFNTVGAGDCFLSGLIYGIENGLSQEDTLRYATAVSAATVASPLSVGYDEALAESLIDQAIVEKIISERRYS